MLWVEIFEMIEKLELSIGINANILVVSEMKIPKPVEGVSLPAAVLICFFKV